MARQKVLMQQQTTIPASGATQANMDAVRVGNNRSGVVSLQVVGFGGGTLVLNIQTADEELTLSSAPTNPDPWINVATFTVTGVTAMKAPVTDLLEVLRWKAGSSTGGMTFRVIGFLSDQT